MRNVNYIVCKIRRHLLFYFLLPPTENMYDYLENPKVSDNICNNNCHKNIRGKTLSSLQEITLTPPATIRFSMGCLFLRPVPYLWRKVAWAQSTPGAAPESNQDPPEQRRHPTLHLSLQTHPLHPAFRRRCGHSTPSLGIGGPEGGRARAWAPILEDWGARPCRLIRSGVGWRAHLWEEEGGRRGGLQYLGAWRGRRRERLGRFISVRYSFCYLFRAGGCDGEVPLRKEWAKGLPPFPVLGGTEDLREASLQQKDSRW